MAVPIDERALLIIGLTVIIILVVVAVRVLTGRPASNLSRRSKPTTFDSELPASEEEDLNEPKGKGTIS